MVISELFERRIEREINGVIMAGQQDDESAKTEIDEYVVTRELKRHFRKFLDAYLKGVDGNTTKMGCWISGFYGSGKSQFLKVLAYLLGNKQIAGKSAYQYFEDEKKFGDDSILLADLKRAVNVSTDVILFNIDAKSPHTTDAIFKVFQNQFNKMCGYSDKNIVIADYERYLEEIGKYQLFKDKFREINGAEWELRRNKYGNLEDDIVQTLVECDLMSETAARNWYLKVDEQNVADDNTIEQFAVTVKEYCERKGNNHHVVFMIDEIGQFIANDRKLMLNLQTITEELGQKGAGKVWVCVTTQQAMDVILDSITKIQGDEFSKISGRFDTRLSLSSANVDEVIRRRLLSKKDVCKKDLTNTYNLKERDIKNIITWSDKVEKETYSSAEDFVEVYPFIPYQMKLLQKVLVSVRDNSSIGKNLAEGERSMLGMFQVAAKKYAQKPVDALVPFHVFFDALSDFVDHEHNIVIIQAGDNSKLNEFDVSVLKVLFLIKYLPDYIPGTQENITTLMISSIDEDRNELEGRVENALQHLLEQALIQKSADRYVFLTNQEQDINRAISREAISSGQVYKQMGNFVFGEIYRDQRYKYNTHHNFPFTQKIEDFSWHDAPATSHLVLQLLTGASYSDPQTVVQRSFANPNTLFVCMKHTSKIETEITRFLQINAYNEKNSASLKEKAGMILLSYQNENEERRPKIRKSLIEAIKEADIYIRGTKLELNSKDAAGRLEESMGLLVRQVYSSLDYMKTEPQEDTIRKIFNHDPQLPLELTNDSITNKQAVEEIERFIKQNYMRKSPTTPKQIYDKYILDPYGFDLLDCAWCCAALFREQRITFMIHGERLNSVDVDGSEIARLLTNRNEYDRISMIPRVNTSAELIDNIKKILADLFETPVTTGTEDELIQTFCQKVKDKKNALSDLAQKYWDKQNFPGKAQLDTYKDLLEYVPNEKIPEQVFAYVQKNKDKFYEYSSNSENAVKFWNSKQHEIFEESVQNINKYASSSNYVPSEKLAELCKQMQDIIDISEPYDQIRLLTQYNRDFSETYDELLKADKADAKQAIESAKTQINSEIEANNLQGKVEYVYAFESIESKLENAKTIAEVRSAVSESTAVRDRKLNDIANMIKASDPSGGEPAKQAKTVYLNRIVTKATASIKTSDDIDTLLRNLKTVLQTELDKNKENGITLYL